MIEETTQPTRPEEALRPVDERHLETLARLSPVGIVRADTEGRCIYVNQTWCDIAGMTAQEALGYGWARALDPRDRERVLSEWQVAVRQGRSVFKTEHRLVHPDGTTTWVLVQALKETGSAGEVTGYIGTTTDITERKHEEEARNRVEEALRESEARLRKTLAEREILLREVHHRVKNNLQVISSLLTLQLGHSKNRHLQALLRDSQARIKAIALVHEKLYQTEGQDLVDLKGYLTDVVDVVLALYASNAKHIDISVAAEPVSLGLDAAVRCGLVVNELVTNAVRHAFPRKRHGQVAVVLAKIGDDQAEITVKDNGVGLASRINPRTVETMGLRLVCHLTAQLAGAVTIDRGHGTSFRVRFKISS